MKRAFTLIELLVVIAIIAILAALSPQLQFTDAKSMVSFVDGHVRHFKIYWNSARYPNGGISLALDYDPPAGYDYKWSGD